MGTGVGRGPSCHRPAGSFLGQSGVGVGLHLRKAGLADRVPGSVSIHLRGSIPPRPASRLHSFCCAKPETPRVAGRPHTFLQSTYPPGTGHDFVCAQLLWANPECGVGESRPVSLSPCSPLNCLSFPSPQLRDPSQGLAPSGPPGDRDTALTRVSQVSALSLSGQGAPRLGDPTLCQGRSPAARQWRGGSCGG